MNNLTGSEWLRKSFSIWSNIKKDSIEKKLKHPALFPSMLADELIKIYTKRKTEKVLDPFMGAGSTIIGAMQNNIRGIGIDLKKEYCEKAKKRVEDFQQDISFDKKKFKEPLIINDDSKNILNHIKKDSIDLVITSPPYWDILNQKKNC